MHGITHQHTNYETLLFSLYKLKADGQTGNFSFKLYTRMNKILYFPIMLIT